MSETLMTTKEVATYLNIHEKQVYALIKENKIPCTRVTGKWVFPRELIDRWINESAIESLSPSKKKRGLESKDLLAAGSNDPLLDSLINFIKTRHEQMYIFTCNTGSTAGLKLLNEGKVDIAWCHLFDPQSETYNINQASSIIENKDYAIIHLFERELCLLLAPELEKKIKDINDIAKSSIPFMNRQKGSGTRIYSDYLLNKLNIDTSKINGYDNEVYTHLEVGLAIKSGEAQAGIATIATSKLFSLPHVPLTKESFDMILLKETFFDKKVQAFIETLNSKEFKKKVSFLGGYNFDNSGKILYSSN